jgi:lambda family phage portal protein
MVMLGATLPRGQARECDGSRRESRRAAALKNGPGAFRIVQGRYDAARTTFENRRHWAEADYLSADSAANPAVRQILRARARYEVANNSYARGLVLTVANDLVGTGPRLQMRTSSAEANREIERQFSSWCDAVGFAELLRTMRVARAEDGEAFALLVTNSALDHPVQLDLRLIEADQVSTPGLMWGVPGVVDGIRFDRFGNPVEYHVLKSHPGDMSRFSSLEYNRVPAGRVIHWFRRDRPGQSRGLPDLMPALPLFAQLRRYTLAVLGAAEAAANNSITFETSLPPDQVAAGGSDDAGLGGTTLELETERSTGVFLPEGWTSKQMVAEQPATTYAMFKREILSEIARCLNVPFNVAACDSSYSNYASGRLDHLLYQRSIKIEQGHLARIGPDHVFESWMAEATLVDGLLPQGAWTEENDPHEWMWPGIEENDPRWAAAESEQVQAGLLTEARYYARRGYDWEGEVAQRKREMEMRTAAGLPQPWDKRAATPAAADPTLDEPPPRNREQAEAPAKKR